VSSYERSWGFIFYSHGWVGRDYDFDLFPFEDISYSHGKKQKVKTIAKNKKIER
jgi:hypothetical protein